MTDSEKMFPVLWPDRREEVQRLRDLGCPRAVPWRIVAPHQRRAMLNHDQTLERLAERGGLSAAELVWVLEDLRWLSEPRTDEQAVPRLLQLLEER